MAEILALQKSAKSDQDRDASGRSTEFLTPSPKTAYILKDYRALARNPGLKLFSLRYKYSDILISVDRESWDPRIPSCAEDALLKAYAELESYNHPEWFASLAPVYPLPCAPSLVLTMSHASSEAGVGPMAAVAGAIADFVLASLREAFPARYSAVENGGDCAVFCSSPSLAALSAGASPFNGKLALELPAGLWGIATSSGTTGHSINFGKADACTIVARSGAEADAWATRCSNVIKDSQSMEEASIIADQAPGIAAFFACSGDTMYYKGTIRLAPTGEHTDEQT